MYNQAKEYVKDLHNMGFKSYDDLKNHPYQLNKLLHYLFNRGDDQKNSWLVNGLFKEAEYEQSLVIDPWKEYAVPANGEI